MNKLKMTDEMWEEAFENPVYTEDSFYKHSMTEKTSVFKWNNKLYQIKYLRDYNEGIDRDELKYAEATEVEPYEVYVIKYRPVTSKLKDLPDIKDLPDLKG